jgi:hypothetical protein
MTRSSMRGMSGPECPDAATRIARPTLTAGLGRTASQRDAGMDEGAYGALLLRGEPLVRRSVSRDGGPVEIRR